MEVERPESINLPKHYYGDTVRRCYVFAAICMLLTLPFFHQDIPVPVFVAIFLVTLIGFFAGITNPRSLWLNSFDFLVSLFAFCTFAYYAVQAFIHSTASDLFFWINELLAVIFFFAFYFSVKTVRGFLVERKS